MDFFFNDTATTEIYTLSLHDALPISGVPRQSRVFQYSRRGKAPGARSNDWRVFQADRKSTRLNSSHLVISYAVFCLKKKHICFSSPVKCISHTPHLLYERSRFRVRHA